MRPPRLDTVLLRDRLEEERVVRVSLGIGSVPVHQLQLRGVLLLITVGRASGGRLGLILRKDRQG